MGVPYCCGGGTSLKPLTSGRSGARVSRVLPDGRAQRANGRRLAWPCLAWLDAGVWRRRRALGPSRQAGRLLCNVIRFQPKLFAPPRPFCEARIEWQVCLRPSCWARQRVWPRKASSQPVGRPDGQENGPAASETDGRTWNLEAQRVANARVESARDKSKRGGLWGARGRQARARCISAR